MKDSPKMGGDGGHRPDVTLAPSPVRRRLLRAGISAAPVAMTVASRPVLADGTASCKSPSGFASINASAPGGGTCAGVTPGYWKTHTSPTDHPYAWPGGYVPTGTNATPFCSAPLSGTKFLCATAVSGKTLLDVLGNGGGPPFDVARHIVSALLNSLVGIVPATILDVSTIVAIWNQYITTGGGTTGYYEPSGPGGPKWDHAMIVDYLVSTMPA
jgi:hypothetical protein